MDYQELFLVSNLRQKINIIVYQTIVIMNFYVRKQNEENLKLVGFKDISISENNIRS